MRIIEDEGLGQPDDRERKRLDLYRWFVGAGLDLGRDDLRDSADHSRSHGAFAGRDDPQRGLALLLEERAQGRRVREFTVEAVEDLEQPFGSTPLRGGFDPGEDVLGGERDDGPHQVLTRAEPAVDRRAADAELSSDRADVDAPPAQIAVKGQPEDIRRARRGGSPRPRRLATWLAHGREVSRSDLCFHSKHTVKNVPNDFREAATVMSATADRHTIELHGHTLAFRMAGQGPVLLLIHGIAGTNAVWEEVFPKFATDHTVIAPDLPGHGESGASAGDYSLGAMAATVRDLLIALGHERATVIGHSLGGGVAMQFSYLFPEFAERLVLISSGGLGRSVNPLLRSAALPGAELVTRGVGLGGRGAGALGRRPPLVPRPRGVLAELERSVAAFADPETRAAFHATLRAVVGPQGQRVFAGDRLYLAETMPTLIVWGAQDRIIPVGHGRRAHDAMPGSRLVILENVGHFAPLDAPEALETTITEFIEQTEPAEPDRERFRRLLAKDDS